MGRKLLHCRWMDITVRLFIQWPVLATEPVVVRMVFYLTTYPYIMADDGGFGVMPPASALASVPLIGSGDIVNMAALGPTTVSPQESAQPLPVEPHVETMPPLPAPQLGLGVSLSPCTAPFPQKLVDKVRSGQYMDMKDLLLDNVSLLEQLDTLGGPHTSPSLPGTLKPRFREIASVSTWAYCFLAYVALQTDDHQVRDRLAYARLMIREAQKHRGVGWLDYDKVFRQQAALDPSLRWNSLHPAIQASTLMGQSANSQTFCRLCREPDHSAGQCALGYLQPPVGNSSAPGTLPAPSSSRFTRRPWDQRADLCLSWNSGQCRFPGACKFRHVCSICLRPHMARDCRATAAATGYRRPMEGGARSGVAFASPAGPGPLL